MSLAAGDERRMPRWFAPGVWAICALLLLVRLGHYPLWDDEACTALLAEGVWHTGDSTAVEGRNVMAYGAGKYLDGSRDRVHPPLQEYLMAPFLGAIGRNAFAARLPFAIVGMGVVALILRWAKRDGLTRRQRWILAAMLVGNVALFLYCRQGRYYALGIFCVLWAAYRYLHLPGRAGRKDLLGVGVPIGLLPLVSLQAFATFAPLFLVDHVLFGRKRTRWGPAAWGALLAPSALAVTLILWRWNPVGVAGNGDFVANLPERPTFVWRAMRDLNNAHMGVGALLMAAPLIGFARRKIWLVRATIAVVLACVLDGLIDPQPLSVTDFAEIRHLAPVIPLTLAIAVGVIDEVWSWKWWAGAAVLVLSATTNVLNWGALQEGTRTRSVQYLWARELISPPVTSYDVAIGWLNAKVPAGATVGIDPNYMRYPLMFHCPDKVYSWQVDPRFRAKLPQLEPRQFIGVEAPEYFIEFCYQDDPELGRAEQLVGHKYERVAESPVYWRDMYRPEITRRRFGGGDEEMTNPNVQGIFLWRRPVTSGTRPSPSP